jgi:hypothetical protein
VSLPKPPFSSSAAAAAAAVYAPSIEMSAVEALVNNWGPGSFSTKSDGSVGATYDDETIFEGSSAVVGGQMSVPDRLSALVCLKNRRAVPNGEQGFKDAKAAILRKSREKGSASSSSVGGGDEKKNGKGNSATAAAAARSGSGSGGGGVFGGVFKKKGVSVHDPPLYSVEEVEKARRLRDDEKRKEQQKMEVGDQEREEEWRYGGAGGVGYGEGAVIGHGSIHVTVMVLQQGFSVTLAAEPSEAAFEFKKRLQSCLGLPHEFPCKIIFAGHGKQVKRESERERGGV